MIVFALDTSGLASSVAVWADGMVLARLGERMARGHAARLMPLAEAAVSAAGIGWRDVDLFAATVGPGAFTGIRIGLAAAGGLALAADRPVAGVTSFEAVLAGLAPGRSAGRTVAVILDSRRGDHFVQLFDAGGVPEGPALVADGAVLARIARGRRLLLAGEAAEQAAELIGEVADIEVAAEALGIDPAAVAAAAAGRPERALRFPPAPLYLRAPDVTPGPTGRRG
jgi:tRNA threonylcarbamoyladenosine biosynthesis protein TsaB